MKKTITLLTAIAICGAVNAENLKVLSLGLGTPGMEEPQLMGLGISPNGKYVCGSIEMGAGYFVGNLETNEFKYAATDDDEGAELRHISNNGIAIGYCGPGITYSFETGEETILQTPEGNWKYVLGEAITNDGTLFVASLVAKGYATYGSYCPAGGTWTQLPLPAAELMGPYADDGTTAKCVSGDGKFILGSIGNNMGPAVLWVRNDAGEYEVDPFYFDYVVMTEEDQVAGTKPLYGLTPISISDNGKYVLCCGAIAGDDGYIWAPVVYETATKTTKIYSDPQPIDQLGAGLFPSAIDDNGTFIGIVGQLPLMASIGSFIMKPGETQAQLLTDVFPEFATTFGFADSIGYVVPTGITANGSKIMGYGFYSDDFTDETAPAYFVTFVLETGEGDSVESISTVSVPEAIYSIDGMPLRSLRQGINIVRMSDGTTRKVIKN